MVPVVPVGVDVGGVPFTDTAIGSVNGVPKVTPLSSICHVSLYVPAVEVAVREFKVNTAVAPGKMAVEAAATPESYPAGSVSHTCEGWALQIGAIIAYALEMKLGAFISTLPPPTKQGLV
jgi:hypothetical protein